MELSRAERFEGPALAIGAVVRLGLILAAQPWEYVHGFLPFLLNLARHPSIDPWGAFLAAGGDAGAFPYGPLYILVFAPLTNLGGLFGGPGAVIGLYLSVLVLDILLFRTLRRMVVPERRSLVTFAYWLSPIVLYVCYWHGQLDVLPVLVLTLAFAMLKERRFAGAGFALGSAIAAKLSMALAAPFIWIYVITARRLRTVGARLIGGSIAGAAVLAPWIFSPGFRRMVFETPEAGRAFALAVPYGPGLTFYVLPLVFTGLIYAAWRIRRFNFEILFNLVGVAFFLLFLLTPAPPGWAMWLTPFLVLHMVRSNPIVWVLSIAFSLLLIAFHLTASTGAMLAGLDFTRPIDLGALVGRASIENLLLSVYLAAGGAFVAQMIREGVVNHPFYRASRAPMMLGIAGDSGAGKDTLAAALIDLFGRPSTALVSGDDYHSWDRHKPMWRALTHLNPRANNLRHFNEDVLALGRGAAIWSRHYDHGKGRMTKPHRIPPTDVVIAAGLHALHTPELNAAYDLKIFLGMDEELRRQFKLARDATVRGHSRASVLASMARREADSERYIRPQRDHADLILELRPLDIVGDEPRIGGAPVRLGLGVEARGPSDIMPLVRVLTGVAGLLVVPIDNPDGWPKILIEGDPSAADIAAAALTLTPNMFDFMALEPQWSGGLTGVMQLIVIDQVSQRLPLRKT